MHSNGQNSFLDQQTTVAACAYIEKTHILKVEH